MNFQIQDPTSQQSVSLHEVLLEACNNSVLGGGAFAFVTQGGIRIFLEDPTFASLVRRGRFELLVGLDEITDLNTVTKLCEVSNNLNGLQIQAFLHNHSGLFHPKFCWFKHPNGSGQLIVGSGNLTVGGLRSNWEAFAVIPLSEEQTSNLQVTWRNWLDTSGDRIRQIDDLEVAGRAAQNARRPRRRGVIAPEPAAAQIPDNLEEADNRVPWEFRDSDVALVAEIPRASNRWNQANFDKPNFENFFGAVAGDNSLRILLRSVSETGDLGEIEIRQSVTVASQNYRFELEAAAGLDYPDNGRPVGIFIKVAPRMFLYSLVMPGDVSSNQVDNFLTERYQGRQDRVRRITVQVRELKEDCDLLPFWELEQN